MYYKCHVYVMTVSSYKTNNSVYKG